MDQNMMSGFMKSELGHARAILEQYTRANRLH